jgi:Ser/Thr protein kinase RdoA (MazF antagonist)
MLPPSKADLETIGRQFQISGRLEQAATHGSGHINDTFLASYDLGGRVLRFIHQRLNSHVFRDPVAHMANVERVLAHLHRRLAPLGEAAAARRALTLVPARDGRAFVRDADGAYWRTYAYVEGTRSYDVALSPRHAFSAARAYATFGRLLSDLPAPRLHETLPGFHDTPARLRALRRAAESDSVGRARGVAEEIEACLSRVGLAATLSTRREGGALPERIAHNDTKMNNVLFDEGSDAALCVIDLDTVMPGLSAHDFGDLVRSAANLAAEDSADPAAIGVDLPTFEAVAHGWIEGSAGELLPAEIDALVPGALVITLECAARFLTDYLEGDVYFRVGREGQNLDRCRTQLALLRSLEAHEPELRSIVAAAAP